MRTRKIAARAGLRAAAALILALWLGVPGAAAAGPSGYQILRRIPVGGTSFWDYVTIDSGARRLYVGRGDHVDVVNLDTGALVGQVTGLAGSGLNELSRAIFGASARRPTGRVMVDATPIRPSSPSASLRAGIALITNDRLREGVLLDFPLTEKSRVIGAEAHPFYRWIAATLGEAGTPRWNFHKYLVGPDGELVGTWPAPVGPSVPRIIAEIERLLPGG